MDNFTAGRLCSLALLHDRVESWDEYPFSVPAIRKLKALDFSSQLTFFVGENGSGKSTLLEAIARHAGFGGEGGSRNFSAHTTDSVHAIEPLSSALRLSWTTKNQKGYFFRAESFFNLATFLDRDPMLLGGYGGRSLHGQSHGESFMSLIMNRFQGRGLYLLDEPEAALSPLRQLAFLNVLHTLLKQNAAVQFIIATHSPIILAYPHSQIFSFDRSPIAEIPYRETESFKLFSGFLQAPENYLHKLFGELF